MEFSNSNMDACQGRGRQRKAGNRDLIIRMLAEVFRVRQSEEGPIRWEQVSSSLVPVSLYSRTTETWLNRLTTDLPIGQVASTMSPDSHRLLLLLHLSSYGQKYARADDDENRVVFQVVAHDFCEGRFWTLLNAKITQPGTKLGHASDYFVYWKNTTDPVMQTSNSFTSNQSSCCHMAQSQTPSRKNLRQTWGLNFASVNDAKLFYDICSLNPVNLSFNSVFLKKFSKSIGLSNFDASLSRQKMMRNHTDSDLQSMASRQSGNTATCSGSARHHSSRVSSPRRRQHTINPEGHPEFVCHDEGKISSCIAHLQNSELHHASLRSRSCSTSRRKNNKQCLDKNISLSTHRLSDHIKASDYGSFDRRNLQRFTTPNNGMHNPNCETLLREQELLREHYHFHNYICPKKPARGQFRAPPPEEPRDSMLATTSEGQQQLTPTIQNSSYVPDGASLQKESNGPDSKIAPHATQQHDQQTSLKFLESKSNQRRSTAVDSSSIQRFNASLARANYAKSKNLSLDVGGFQSTPTHPSAQKEGSRKPAIEVANRELDSKKENLKLGLNTSKIQQELDTPENKMVVQQKEGSSKPDDQVSLDYQFQLDALAHNVGVPYGFDTTRCEASTTTEDLPLDPIVRKRMFQLSSTEYEKENFNYLQESCLQRERLIRANESSEYFVNRHDMCFRDNRRQSIGIGACSDLDPLTQMSGPSRPSFSAQQQLSNSSSTSSPDVDAGSQNRMRKRVRAKSTSYIQHTSDRSKTQSSVKNQDDYACCLDMIGRTESQKDASSLRTINFNSVPNITDLPIYDYNFDLMNTQESQQLCSMQKLSNTLSSVSDFEH